MPGPPRYATRGNSVRRGRRRDEAKGGKPVRDKGLCADSRLIEAERRLQPSFRKVNAFQQLGRWRCRSLRCGRCAHMPRPTPLAGARRGRFSAGALSPCDVGPLRLAGAWRLSARRSALRRTVGAGGRPAASLLALTDSGAVVRFAPPAPAQPMRFALHDLPDGPGNARQQVRRATANRCSPIRGGRGWWVGVREAPFAVAVRSRLRARAGEARSARRRLARPIAAARRWSRGDGGAAGAAREAARSRSAGGADRSRRRGRSRMPTRLPDGRLAAADPPPRARAGSTISCRIARAAGKPARRIAARPRAARQYRRNRGRAAARWRDAAVDRDRR